MLGGFGVQLLYMAAIAVVILLNSRFLYWNHADLSIAIFAQYNVETCV